MNSPPGPYDRPRRNATHGAATDVRVREPACDRWEAQPGAEARADA